jgi:uncharacterized protein
MPTTEAGMERALAHYGQLREKIDAMFSKACGKYRGHMRCEPGCDDCCRRDLTLYAFEVRSLLEELGRMNKATVRRVVARAREACADSEAACPLLEEGRCLTYSKRPIICRSHGLAMLVPGTGELSVCPHNFVAAEHIDGDCVLDLTPVNNILATLSELLVTDTQTAGFLTSVRVSVSRAIVDSFDPETRE